MIRNILIVKLGGKKLFEQQLFKPFPQSNMVSQLCAGMINAFSQFLSPLLPCYLEFATMALSLCVNDEILVYVFHDPSDGPKFGRFLAFQIMALFTRMYPVVPESIDVIKKNFLTGFGDVLLGARKDLLIHLTWSPGIHRAFILNRDSPFMYSSDVAPTDSLSIEANFDSILKSSMEILTLSNPNEITEEIILEGAQHRIFILQINSKAYLVVHANKNSVQKMLRYLVFENIMLLRNAYSMIELVE